MKVVISLQAGSCLGFAFECKKSFGVIQEIVQTMEKFKCCKSELLLLQNSDRC